MGVGLSVFHCTPQPLHIMRLEAVNRCGTCNEHTSVTTAMTNALNGPHFKPVASTAMIPLPAAFLPLISRRHRPTASREAACKGSDNTRHGCNTGMFHAVLVLAEKAGLKQHRSGTCVPALPNAVQNSKMLRHRRPGIGAGRNLALSWYCADTSRLLRWCCAGTAVVLLWYHAGTTPVLHKHCTAIVLVLRKSY